MPLSINVGLSRKASRDYQSHGVSINVTAELDQALLAKPAELRKQIDDLYHLADAAMQRQAGVMGNAAQAKQRNLSQPRQTSRSNGDRSNGNHANVNGNRNQSNSNGGHVTASQRGAILAIAERADIDLQRELHDIVGCGLDDLTIRQASDFIDHLKRIASAPSGN